VRSLPQISGSAWYSSKQFNREIDGFREKLRSTIYPKPSIIPAMPWIDRTAPNQPSNLKVTVEYNGQTISWDPVLNNNEMNKGRFYALYGSNKKKMLKNPDHRSLIDITGNNYVYFKDQQSKRKKKYYYRITALDRLNNESSPSDMVILKQ